ncbi:MAG TPA: extradiol ring-cleavage dioxygenase [Chloroflexota bacterium]|nr:extradiol ring-cleavage dioxygenase [Chloroflexota bacterium]
MGEILGIGVTHHPGFLGPEENLAYFLEATLRSERVPAHLKDPRNWPAPMQAEWGADRGRTAAAEHRRRVVEGFRAVRRQLDAFRPDFVVIWGDDQYEQFTEECIPPFAVFILDEFRVQPFQSVEYSPGERNAWGEPVDKLFCWRGHREGASYLTQGLIEAGFDIAYAYRLRPGARPPHSFVNTLLYLDYDRSGFDYGVVPFHVNCYGSTVVRSRGGLGHLESAEPGVRDPSAPPPWRCFELGRATARILRDSPWRVALIASSSWSHAFLTEKTGWIHPDIESDQRLLRALRAGEYTAFRDLTIAEAEAAGQHEIFNWVCLAGAMHELSYRPDYLEYVETYIFNSDKCLATFGPAA